MTEIPAFSHLKIRSLGSTKWCHERFPEPAAGESHETCRVDNSIEEWIIPGVGGQHPWDIWEVTKSDNGWVTGDNLAPRSLCGALISLREQILEIPKRYIYWECGHRIAFLFLSVNSFSCFWNPLFWLSYYEKGRRYKRLPTSRIPGKGLKQQPFLIPSVFWGDLKRALASLTVLCCHVKARVVCL